MRCSADATYLLYLFHHIFKLTKKHFFMLDYSKKLMSSSTFAFMGFVLAAIFSYLTRIILARNLSVEDVGLFFSVLNLIIFVTLFQKIGIEMALVRYVNVWKEQGRFDKIKQIFVHTFWFQVIIGLFYAAILYLVSDTVTQFYFHNMSAKILLLFLTPLLLLLVFEDLPRRVFQGFNNMIWFSLLEAGKALLLLLFITIGFFSGPTILVPVFAYLGATFVISIIAIIGIFRYYPFFKEKGAKEKGLFREVFLFGIHLIFFVIGNKVVESLDLLILTYYAPLEQVGIYSIVLPTAALGLFVYRTLAVVVLPLASELWERNDVVQLTQLLRLIHRYLYLLMVPLIILFYCYAEFVLSFLFGPTYADGATALRIIIIGSFFFGLCLINISLLTAIGSSKKAGIIMLYSAGINVLFNFLLIPYYGMVGASIATLISYLLAFIISLIFVKKEITKKDSNFSFYLPKLRFYIALGSFLVLLILLNKILPQTSIITILSTIIISFVSYIILINRLNLYTLKEIKEVWHSIRKK